MGNAKSAGALVTKREEISFGMANAKRRFFPLLYNPRRLGVVPPGSSLSPGGN
jgi:hypothetical protein